MRMDERERRVGENEALARKTNERLDGLNETFSEFSGVFQIICECGAEDCDGRIDIAPAEYADLRSVPTHFAVVPGHEAPTVERVLEHRPGYDVVRKLEGEPAEAARSSDPRS